MGRGFYSDDAYNTAKTYRATNNISDFHHNETSDKVHPTLDPLRIKDKPFKKLESRDNDEHPNSNAVMVCFDVTGSNIDNAVIVQKQLPKLMGLLGKYLSDVQVAVAANDDILAVGSRHCVQISEFESDIRIDESIRNLLLTGNGGGNSYESYDLVLYGIARKTVLDSWEKRHKKGYLFIYADELMREQINKEDINSVYGDKLTEDITLNQIITELKIQYNVYVIFPANSSYIESKKQYKQLFGKNNVLTLESPKVICELIGTVIGMNEDKSDNLVDDLVSVGTSSAVASQMVEELNRQINLEDVA
jgi:hypothetical protein